MKIGFVGLGKLGLPVAVTIGCKGHDVKGYDINPRCVETTHPRELHYTEECDETGTIGTTMDAMFSKTTLTLTSSLKTVVEWADLIFVAVQTPHDAQYEGITRIPSDRKDFDYSYLVNALSEISKEATGLGKSVAVVVISTVLPGTLRKYVFPVIGPCVKLCYNPYFIAMGTTVRDFIRPEFILFGRIDSDITSKVKEFYQSISDSPIYETSLENAELIKVSYNTMISTKILFANMLMELCHHLPGTNVDEITNALKMANKRLISTAYLTAGMGDGGGCHPRDNIAMSWLSDRLGLSINLFDFIMIGREKQTEFLANLVIHHAQRTGLPIIMLGKSFKVETNITVGSPAVLLANLLKEHGHEVGFYDPHVDGCSGVVTNASLFFLATPHQCFADYEFPAGSVVLDPHRFFKNLPTTIDYIPVGVHSL